MTTTASTLERALPPPARILVAEDTGIHGELTRHLLERHGYAVDVVTDGAAAVAAFEKGRYALVLMDCRMPSMDGCAATQAIRRLGDFEPERREQPCDE